MERGRDGGVKGEEVGSGGGDGGGGGRGDAGKDDLLFEEREREHGVEGGSVRRGVGGCLGQEEKIEMEMARLLLSKSRWKGEVMDRFVCMRWKEKCFVRNFPSPSASSSSSSRKRGKRGSEGVDGAGGSDESGDQISSRPHGDEESDGVGSAHHDEDESDSAHEDDQSSQQQGHGLTISGFYYIVLDRQTGGVEGLYYDPASTPFQRLKLSGCSSSQSRSRRPSSPGGGGAAGGKSAGNGAGSGGGGNGGGMVWPAVGFA